MGDSFNSVLGAIFVWRDCLVACTVPYVHTYINVYTPYIPVWVVSCHRPSLVLRYRLQKHERIPSLGLLEDQDEQRLLAKHVEASTWFEAEKE